MAAPRALRRIRLAHTAIWAVVEACVAYLVWSGLRGRTDRRDAVAATVVGAEIAVFVGYGLRCPLTDLAERAGAGDGSVTDLYLPRPVAHALPVIHVPLLLFILHRHRGPVSALLRRGRERRWPLLRADAARRAGPPSRAR